MKVYQKALLSLFTAFATIAVVTILILPSNAHFGLLKQTSLGEPTKSITQSFSYNGQNGRDALSLLREKAVTVQDKSGLVISINGRSVDSNKHEFWAFYVNGKQANVGPGAYKTKNSDIILWKIETY